MVSLKDPEVKARVMDEIRAAGNPVTINYLVKKTELCYNSIQTILLHLVIKGELKQQEVSSGLKASTRSSNNIFWIPNTVPAFQEKP